LTVLGPIVGGIVVDTISWRVAFLINVPLLAVALWATLAHVEESRDVDAAAKFDWLGAVVAALAVGGLSFGLIRGQSNDWADTAAWVAIAVGTLALIAFPVLMARRKDPLVPLGLFRQRAFATINLATFFIYGALYVTITFQALLLQGVLGYTALLAPVRWHPGRDHASVLSTWIGTLSARMGARRSRRWPDVHGGIDALVRPSARRFEAVEGGDRVTGYAPPAGFTLVDVLPSVLLFGLGISMVVAPLTSTLMSSIPGRFSGLGSAINNSISRVGQPLLGAIIFIAISASFYGSLAAKAPDLDTGSADVRAAFQPLNPPPATATAEQVTAATQASIDAFHLSMIVIAALSCGGLVSWFRLRGARRSDG
jgi:hypothetical protein